LCESLSLLLQQEILLLASAEYSSQGLDIDSITRQTQSLIVEL
jgi:hypothetical protein